MVLMLSVLQGDKILSKILAEFESMHRSLKIALVNALYEAIESGAHRPCDTFFKTVRLCSLATDQACNLLPPTPKITLFFTFCK